MTSARMKPRSKSVWITPAACGAVAPRAPSRPALPSGPTVKIGLQAEQLGRRRGSRGSTRLVEPEFCAGTRRARPPRAARSRPRSPRTPATTTGAFGRAPGARAHPSSGLSREAALVDVGHVHHRLHRQQLQLAQIAPLLGRQRHERARAGPHRADRVHPLEQRRGGAVASLSPPLAALSARSRPFSSVARSASASSVLMTSMSRQRVDAAGHVHDVVVLEAAHHVRDRIDLADVRQELVAEPLALRGAGDEAGDVDELHRGRQDLLRVGDCQPARPAADRAPAPRRRSGRWCRTGSSRPRSARASAR